MAHQSKIALSDSVLTQPMSPQWNRDRSPPLHCILTPRGSLHIVSSLVNFPLSIKHHSAMGGLHVHQDSQATASGRQQIRLSKHS